MNDPSETLVRLVPAVELTDLSYYDLRATRRMRDAESDAHAEGRDLEDEVEPSYALAIDTDQERNRFRLRLRVELTTPVGDVVAEAGAEYAVDEAFPIGDLTHGLLVEYANHVGVMALLPYLRQVIADLTQRVFGGALLMPVLPRGAVTFPTPEPAAPAGTGDTDG